MDLGYLPDQTTWKSYPTKMRKQYSRISQNMKFNNFILHILVTFEEAMQHETNVDNPTGDSESTDRIN